MTVTDGYFTWHNDQWRTYYRIVGTPSAKAPLVLLHGGPGSTHTYFEVLDGLAVRLDRQLIMYDQLGCGRSTIPTDPAVYRAETWVEELQALRRHLKLEQIHLLGQSWGGMLAIIYLCDYAPSGVQSVILSSTLSSARLWAQEQHRLLQYLPLTAQEALKQAEVTGNYSGSAYQAADALFMQYYCRDRAVTNAEPLQREVRMGTESYVAAWGPNELVPQGTLKDYEYTDKLQQVKVPALITSGTDDLCTPLVAKTMYDRLPNARWELFAGAKHMAFAEQTTQYADLLDTWLAERQ